MRFKSATWSIAQLNVGALIYGSVNHPLWQPAPYPEERVKALAPALLKLDPDVIVLEELHRPRHRQAVKAALPGYQAVPVGDEASYPWQVNSGLMILCKRHWPIVHSHFEKFRDQAVDEDFFGQKGVLLAIVDAGVLGRVGVLGFHATVGGIFKEQNAPKTERQRARQIEQIFSLAGRKLPLADYFLLVGDLNAGPEISAVNYRQMLFYNLADTFSQVPHTAEELIVTWDPANPLNQRGPHRHLPKQRVDHIFLDYRAARDWQVSESSVVLTEPVVRLPSGQAVTVSDHYGLFTRLKAKNQPRFLL